MERKLADADVTEEEQDNLLKDLERKETEYMRLQRHKMGVDDFELLTIIGRGAFGEVCFHLGASSMYHHALHLHQVVSICSSLLSLYCHSVKSVSCSALFVCLFDKLEMELLNLSEQCG